MSLPLWLFLPLAELPLLLLPLGWYMVARRHRPITAWELRELRWLLYKGRKASEALDQGDVERATEILRMKL